MLPATGYPLYGIPCDPWKGHPSEHQDEARLAIGSVPPFTWVVTACSDKMCLIPEHLIIRQPKHLGYQAGICIYCGLDATTRDHLVPEPWSGPTIREWVVTVPACRECNLLINDRLTFSITERRAYAHQHIRRRYRKWLRCKLYTPAEISEFGRNIRSSVNEGMRMRKLIEARLAWPPDPFYDLHAAQDAGIENPYLIGMLGAP